MCDQYFMQTITNYMFRNQKRVHVRSNDQYHVKTDEKYTVKLTLVRYVIGLLMIP